jgi:phosphoribosylformimino-5-aminoimidazole carboxamide ribotide isomerase
MDTFRIVPVADIKDGKAVHAVKGQRDQYRPASCPWCEDGDIETLISGYQTEFGLDDLYIADLDAIVHGTPATDVYPFVLGLVPGKVMIDAGVATMDNFHEIEASGFEEIILGTETVSSLDVFQEAIDQGLARVIISIDLRDGKVISPIEALGSKPPEDVVPKLERLEPAAMIILNISAVGARSGVAENLAVIPSFTSIPVYTGGGTRSIADLFMAREAGFAGALLATALQDGSITRADLDGFRSGQE